MTSFIAPERLPLGFDVTWEGYATQAWDQIKQIEITAGMQPDGLPGIVAVRHNVELPPYPALSAGQETTLLLHGMYMSSDKVVEVTERSYRTMIDYLSIAFKRLGTTSLHLAIQELFNRGILTVEQHLQPATPPSQPCQELLRHLAVSTDWTKVGEAMGGIAAAAVKKRVNKFEESGELPPEFIEKHKHRQPGYILWGNATGIIKPSTRKQKLKKD